MVAKVSSVRFRRQQPAWHDEPERGTDKQPRAKRPDRRESEREQPERQPVRRSSRQRAQTRPTRLPPDEPPARSPLRGRGHEPAQGFRCGHCKRFVPPLPSGGRQRNHCPYCLYSRHVDEKRPGDRASACRSLMAPIGAFQRPNGEHVLVHRCLGCGFERFNRIGADDDFDLVLSLPVVPPRSARDAGGQDEPNPRGAHNT